MCFIINISFSFVVFFFNKRVGTRFIICWFLCNCKHWKLFLLIVFVCQQRIIAWEFYDLLLVWPLMTLSFLVNKWYFCSTILNSTFLSFSQCNSPVPLWLNHIIKVNSRWSKCWNNIIAFIFRILLKPSAEIVCTHIAFISLILHLLLKKKKMKESRILFKAREENTLFLVPLWKVESSLCPC